eukprot:TRINITY_DN16737_c0_g3_i1.p1 TRINITY_DN16737_c0_g3~~TRINITY_DN16737_c0_g3_i1.p1  ORF type:complete len:1462 (+),score=552.92 TRINITY_DN16737_c0_g3_i1:108-4388(+)
MAAVGRVQRSQSSVEDEIAFSIKAVQLSESTDLCARYGEELLAVPAEDAGKIKSVLARQFVEVGTDSEGVVLYENDALRGLIQKACGVTSSSVNAAVLHVLSLCYERDMDKGHEMCIVGSGAVELVEKQFHAEKLAPKTLQRLAQFLNAALSHSALFRAQWARKISGGAMLTRFLSFPLASYVHYKTSLRHLMRCVVVWYHHSAVVQEEDLELYTALVLKALLAGSAPEDSDDLIPENVTDCDAGDLIYQLLALNVVAQTVPLLEQAGRRLALEAAWRPLVARYVTFAVPLIANRFTPATAAAIERHVAINLPVQYSTAHECLEGHLAALTLSISYEIGFCTLSICRGLLCSGAYVDETDSLLSTLLLVLSRLTDAKAKTRSLVDVRRKWSEVERWCADRFYTDGCEAGDAERYDALGVHWGSLAMYPGLQGGAAAGKVFMRDHDVALEASLRHICVASSEQFQEQTRAAIAPLQATMPALLEVVLGSLRDMALLRKSHSEAVATPQVFRQLMGMLQRSTYHVPTVLEATVRLLVVLGATKQGRQGILSSGIFAVVLKLLASKDTRDAGHLLRALRMWLGAAPAVQRDYDAVRMHADVRCVLPFLRLATVETKAVGVGQREAVVHEHLLGLLEDAVARRPCTGFDPVREADAVTAWDRRSHGALLAEPEPFDDPRDGDGDEDGDAPVLTPAPVHQPCFVDEHTQEAFLEAVAALLYCPDAGTTPLERHPPLMVKAMSTLQHAAAYRGAARKIEALLYTDAAVMEQLRGLAREEETVWAALEALEAVLPVNRMPDDGPVGLGWSGNLAQLALLTFVKDTELSFVIRFQRFWRRRQAKRWGRRLLASEIDEEQARSAVLCDEAECRGLEMLKFREACLQSRAAAVQFEKFEETVLRGAARMGQYERVARYNLHRAHTELLEAEGREAMGFQQQRGAVALVMSLREALARAEIEREEDLARRGRLSRIAEQVSDLIVHCQRQLVEFSAKERRTRKVVLDREVFLFTCLLTDEPKLRLQRIEGDGRRLVEAAYVAGYERLSDERFLSQTAIVSSEEGVARKRVGAAAASALRRQRNQWALLQANSKEWQARLGVNKAYSDGLVYHYSVLVLGIERCQFKEREGQKRWRVTSEEKSAWARFETAQLPRRCAYNEWHYRGLIKRQRRDELHGLRLLEIGQRVNMMAREERVFRLAVEKNWRAHTVILGTLCQRSYFAANEKVQRQAIATEWHGAVMELAYFWIRRVLKASVRDTLALEATHRHELGAYALAYLTVLQLHCTRELEAAQRRRIHTDCMKELRTIRVRHRKLEQEVRLRRAARKLWSACVDHSTVDISVPAKGKRSKKHTRPCAKDPLAANQQTVRRVKPKQRPASANPRGRTRFADQIHHNVAMGSFYAQSPYTPLSAFQGAARAATPTARSMPMPFTPSSAF